MTENALTLFKKDMRCSRCSFGHQIVAGVGGEDIEDDGTETRWVLVESIPAGQTRNCFNLQERILRRLGLVELNHFVNPGEDDACIYRTRFKPKSNLA